MACAAVVAIQLSLTRAIYPNWFSSAPVAITILAVVTSTFTAIAVTLGLISIYWRFRGLPSLSQPGQYLLIGQIVSAVAFYGMIAAMVLMHGGDILGREHGFARFLVMSWAYTAQYTASLLFSAWCTWKVADTRAWRAVFAIRTIGSLLSACLAFPVMFYYLQVWMFGKPQLIIYGSWLLRGLIQLIADCAAGANDRRRALPRSSTHWAGLFLSIIGDVLSIASAALYALLQQ